jgi:tetratricopeptide (TPR) repeat protein
LEAEARSLPQGSATQNAKYADALAEVRAALKLDECDLDALELAAKLARCLNIKGALLEALNKFEQEARLQKKPVRYARALRFQAELLEERATKGALSAARIKLETGLESLEDPDAGDERPYELALLNEQLASLHIKRGTPTLVEKYLDEADEIYKTLPAPEGPAGLERIEHLRARLAQALRGGDESEEPEENGGALFADRPTHVNTEPLQVFREIGQIGDLGPKLEPFTAVTVQSEHENWALVARDGERLGYVDRTKLHKLL